MTVDNYYCFIQNVLKTVQKSILDKKLMNLKIQSDKGYIGFNLAKKGLEILVKHKIVYLAQLFLEVESLKKSDIGRIHKNSSISNR